MLRVNLQILQLFSTFGESLFNTSEVQAVAVPIKGWETSAPISINRAHGCAGREHGDVIHADDF
jgi:hypothetical protein